ncbi:hypothetical protein [Litorihabitans aurantiacus]|uniref:Uncharacterized protein n=1 Tax=Litorihabitans aurantiacus TaxID=1930061 RepID=A0AA38CRP5_9MICO|nr:hypothetical protein [Litorihabitans aurantiacus]GMA32036.1 hypothetical protein GCM10025875_20280 [Litorihabitans aurantiacus]
MTTSSHSHRPAATLAQEVRRLAHGRPYTVVDETDDAFTVHIDVVDAGWWTLFKRKHLTYVFTHRVSVKHDGRAYSVRDTRKTLAWEAGVDVAGGVPRPVIRGSMTFATGTIREKSFRREIAFDDELRPGVVVDYTFSSNEGNQLIEQAARRLGMRKTMNGVSIFALVVALVAGVGSLLGVGIAALTGAFG